MAAADFHAQMSPLFEYVRTTPLAAGAKEILIPGEPEARTMRERLVVVLSALASRGYPRSR